MRKYLLATACFVCVLAACSVQPESEGWKGNYEETINEISVSVAPFNMDGVKSSLDPSGQFSWQSDDKIAFIPQNSDAPFGVQQSMFYVETGGSSAASFKAVGWGLLIGNQYFSYYPYSDTATAESVTVDYTGQRQTSAGNTEHLGKYDYLHAYTDPIAVESKKDVEYKHLGGIAQFTIDLSEIDGYSSKHFTKLTLECSDNVIAESASYNPSVANAAISSDGKTLVSALDIALGSDDSGLTCSSNILNVYAMMCPTEWLGHKITAKLTDSEKKFYEGEFTPKSDLGAGEGKFYKIKATDPNAVVDLAKNGSANCYIVEASKVKEYSFPIYYGNTTNPVSGVAKVGILWETDNTTTAPGRNSIISKIEIKDNKVVFTATGKAGNALIAAYGNGSADPEESFSEGNILWTWHIWCTDKPGDDQYGSNYLMDRNLGALATSGTSSIGLLYQWGRKDPFLGGTSFTDAKEAVAETTKGETNIPNRCVPQRLPLSEGQFHVLLFPTVLFSCTDTEKFWTSNINYGYWSTSKTQYDPCPPGYKIPDDNIFNDYTAQSVTNGYTVNGKYFPLAGCRYTGGSKTLTYNASAYWTNVATQNDNRAPSGYKSIGHACIKMENSSASIGSICFVQDAMSVRCQKIQ